MSLLVITEQGSRLTRKDGRLLVTKNGNVIYVRPLNGLESIIVLGRIEIGTVLLSYLLRNGVETIFMSTGGNFRGRLVPAFSKNAFIRRVQYQKLDDAEFRLQFSRALISAKTENYGRIMRKQARVAYAVFQPRLENMRRSLNKAGTNEVLRGLEGSFSTLYFQNLPAMLVDDFNFKKRIKHPPPDPLNILLSLAYTMVFNNIYAFVEASGLDPYCGFFHELKYGHPALVSDLMEEFRAPLADALVITLINHKQIVPRHFSVEKDKVVFGKEGLAIFFEQYRKKVTTKFGYNNMQLNFLQIMERQVWHFMRVLKGEDKQYAGYVHR